MFLNSVDPMSHLTHSSGEHNTYFYEMNSPKMNSKPSSHEYEVIENKSSNKRSSKRSVSRSAQSNNGIP